MLSNLSERIMAIKLGIDSLNDPAPADVTLVSVGTLQLLAEGVQEAQDFLAKIREEGVKGVTATEGTTSIGDVVALLWNIQNSVGGREGRPTSSVSGISRVEGIRAGIQFGRDSQVGTNRGSTKKKLVIGPLLEKVKETAIAYVEWLLEALRDYEPTVQTPDDAPPLVESKQKKTEAKSPKKKKVTGKEHGEE